jgi:tetratricopeptide (TPR) repeat protein
MQGLIGCREAAPRHLLAFLSLLVLLATTPGCSSLPRSRPAPSESSIQAGHLRELALEHYRAGRFDRAEVFFTRELALHAAVDRRAMVAEVLASLGRVSLARGELEAAEVRFLRSLEAAQGLLRVDLQARAMGGLGALELHRAQPQTAHDWFQRALDLPLDDHGHERAVLLHDLGVALRMLGDDGLGHVLLNDALAMHEALQDRAGIATASRSLALMHAEAGDLEDAVAMAQRALVNDRLNEDALLIAEDLALLGHLTARAGRAQQARQYYRRAELAYEALGLGDQARQVAERLRELSSADR